MTQRYPQAYRQLLKKGPFPGRIDPWVEIGRYFHQLHAQMIGSLMAQNQDKLLEMGYLIGRETSLQVAERREPDIYVEREAQQPLSSPQWDYIQAAQAVLVEPGIAVEDIAFELDSIVVYKLDSTDLVSIIEVISPSNKVEPSGIREYVERRDHLVRGKGIKIVELDLTRSVKRLIRDTVADAYAYHIAVHLPRERARFIGIDLHESLKPFALPLQNEVLVVETQAAYDEAYHESLMAGHIDKEIKYAEAELPFPSLITSQQKHDASKAVQHWRTTLEQLREQPHA